MFGLVLAYSRAITAVKKRGRKIQDSVLYWPAFFLRRHEVSPNALTMLSMFVVLLSSILIYNQDKLYLLALPLAVVLDMLDGTLARMYRKDDFGTLFDFFSDRFSDSLIILALTAAGLLGYYFASALLFFYVLSTLLVKMLESLDVKVYILSFRIIILAGLLLQELNSSALFLASALLLANYSLTALLLLPKVALRHK